MFLPSIAEWDNSGWLQVFCSRRSNSEKMCLHFRWLLSSLISEQITFANTNAVVVAVKTFQLLTENNHLSGQNHFCLFGCFNILDVGGRIWIHKMMMCQTSLPFEAYNSLKEILFDSCIHLLSSVPHFLHMTLCQDYYGLNYLRTTWCARHVHSHCYNGIKSHFYIFKSNLKEHVSLEDYPKESRNPCFTLALACKCKRRAITLLLVRHRDITGQKVTAEWLWPSEK